MLKKLFTLTILLTTGASPIYSTNQIRNDVNISIPFHPSLKLDSNNFFKTIAQPIETISSSCQQINKLKIGMYALGLASGATLIYSLHARRTLYNKKNWCNWLPGIPFNKLIKIDEKKLYEHLKKEIDRRYETSGCDNETITMHLPQFLKETSREINTLSTYVNIGNLLQTIHINNCFIMTQNSINSAQEKIRRIKYLRTIVGNAIEPENIFQRLTLIN